MTAPTEQPMPTVNSSRDETQAVARYREALASGLSDYEAREEGWPTKIENGGGDAL